MLQGASRQKGLEKEETADILCLLGEASPPSKSREKYQGDQATGLRISHMFVVTHLLCRDGRSQHLQ